jgi:hypothetical protein
MWIIEPHPIQENIAITADYEGKIIIWDIAQGKLLQMFSEMAYHLNNPNLYSACVDARWNPDGYSFAVTSYYGTISIFGYGD